MNSLRPYQEVSEKIARHLRCKIHDLTGKGHEPTSPDNAANAAWLKTVVAGDVPAVEKMIADAVRPLEKCSEVLLRAYQHVSHGGPTRAEVEAVLKEAGLL